MKKLNREELWSLEEYSERRNDFRTEVMAHKKNRHIALGENARFYFEDRLTIQYQVQEMLRIEKVFDKEGIEDELEAYNPLIPDGDNWKATFMLEYPDAEERKEMVTALVGIEKKIWVQVEGFDPIAPIADEDLEREDGERTSTVHFLRFQFNYEMVGAMKYGAEIKIGIDHPAYNISGQKIEGPVLKSLLADLNDIAVN